MARLFLFLKERAAVKRLHAENPKEARGHRQSQYWRRFLSAAHGKAADPTGPGNVLEDMILRAPVKILWQATDAEPSPFQLSQTTTKPLGS